MSHFFWTRCSRRKVRKAVAQTMTESGRKITKDWASVRDAPPVANSSAKNKPRIQNIGDGLAPMEWEVGKTGLV